MYKKKTICYWSPFINNVATIKAVYNSALSLNKYSNGELESIIIDVFGEWKNNNNLNLNKLKINRLNYIKFLFSFSSEGFLKSRIKYIIIFIYSFFSLKKYLTKFKPDYLVVHLITSLPLFLNLLFNFDTKLILRISGKPQMNLLRYLFWKIALKKVYKITFPTLETLEYFKNLNFSCTEKFSLLYDPIIEINDVNKKKREPINNSEIKNSQYFLAIGRLTKQKNFLFLVKCFNKLLLNNPSLKLVIIGEGEEESKIRNFINDNKLQNNIHLLGFKKNVFKYFKNCKAFILSSLWEDPGFVIVEAITCETLVLSSDCQSGPNEIIGNKNGILFKNNSESDFIKKFNLLINLNQREEKYYKINAKKKSKSFSIFNHYKNLYKLLNE
jgi:glycosyltransferase involved in cell wall biosynthesis